MLIGLIGRTNSGKNTTAKFLQEQYDFLHLSFAKALKDATAAIFNFPRNLLEGDTNEGRLWRELPDQYWSEKLNIQNFTPRLALQMIGSDVMRDHFNKDIWIYNLETKLQTNQNIVVSDIRYHNEYDLIKKYCGTIVKIIRPDEKYLLHKSEQYIDEFPFNYIIYNKSSIQDLQKKLNILYEKIR